MTRAGAPAFIAPAFIAVEGVDGCGKTGIVGHLVDHLRGRGHEVLATREPGGTAPGERIRALILSGADEAWDPRSELLLMNAARVEHVARVVRPALARGCLVVTDRYVGSTLAYQGAGRGLPEDLIRALHATAVGDLWPDLTLVLDLDAETGLARSRRRQAGTTLDEGRFETLDLAFHRRVRAAFLDQARRDPGRHAVVDASGTPEAVRALALSAVDAWFDRRPGGRDGA